MQLPKEDNGRLLMGGELKPIWFDGDQLPESLVPGPEELSDRDGNCESRATDSLAFSLTVNITAP